MNLKVYQGDVLLGESDSGTVVVDGWPLGDCERAIETNRNARSASVNFLDLITRTRSFTVKIYQEHAAQAGAIVRGIMARENATRKTSFAVWMDTGSVVHKFTAANAAWDRISPKRVTGRGSWLTYRVTCGPLKYTQDAGTDEVFYDDVRDSVFLTLEAPVAGWAWAD